MKAAAVLVLVSALLGLAAANEIDKQQLCTEVCWTYDVNNHTDCQKRCVEGNVWARDGCPVLFLAELTGRTETHRRRGWPVPGVHRKFH